jgi:hypothetical protein
VFKEERSLAGILSMRYDRAKRGCEMMSDLSCASCASCVPLFTSPQQRRIPL